MSRRAFLHIGSPKTGTTFLQSVLWRGRDAVATAGVVLPGASIHDHFHACCDVRGVPGRSRTPDLVPGTWDRLVEEIRRTDDDVLISHELFASASAEQAAAAVASLERIGCEVHVVLTARDLARQITAEWQERLKHRAISSFETFVGGLDDPKSKAYAEFWSCQDYDAVLARWADGLPPAQVHVVTVPPSGAAPGLLWERFAAVIGVPADAVSLDVPRENSSLGVEQSMLLWRINNLLGKRLPMPMPYAPVVKDVYAQRILSERDGTKLVLGGDDRVFARKRSDECIAALAARGVTVHGDLEELRVEDAGPEVSSPRVEVPAEVLLEESLAVTADLLAAYAKVYLERRELQREVKELRRGRPLRRRIGGLLR